MRLFYLYFAFLLSLSGCLILPIPHQRPIAPIVKGIVIDSNTNEPVVDAKIYLAPAHQGQEEFLGSKLFQQSTQNGVFSTEPVSESANWFYFVLLPMEGICDVRLVVEHPDYSSFEKEVGYWGSGMVDGTVCSSNRVTSVDVKLVPR